MFQTKKNPLNNNKILINCDIIDPDSQYRSKGEIIIENNKIIDFGKDILANYEQARYEIIDCKQNIVCPGLIDLQVHFRDPGQSNKEDLITGSKAAVAGGITSVVCQPNTKPVIDNLDTVEYIKSKANDKAYCNIYLYAAITSNMGGKELSDMKKLATSDLVVGFTDDGLPVMDSHIMRKAFEIAKELEMPLAQHAEDLNLTNKGAINEGEVSKKLAIAGIANASESIIVARDIELVKLTQAKYHLLHTSVKESLPHIRAAKKLMLPVTAEVTPHHFLLTDKEIYKFGSNAKMNPPLRSEEDRLALIEALQDGTIDAIATDHAPHEEASKTSNLQTSSFGIVGVETLLPLSLELYHTKKLNLIDLLAKLTINPAKIINIARGKIAKGAIADLTVIDLNHEWVINKNNFYSKSNNTPFDGRKVKGCVTKTFVAGAMVYQKES
jgi:dihydroorotase